MYLCGLFITVVLYFCLACMCNLFPKVVTLFFYSNKSVRTRA